MEMGSEIFWLCW